MLGFGPDSESAAGKSDDLVYAGDAGIRLFGESDSNHDGQEPDKNPGIIERLIGHRFRA